MSDILIKNMEMPSERTMFEVFPDGKVFEIHPNNNARIPTESVAIPVPEHGQLIDRDAVLKEYNHVGYMWQEVPRIAHEELVHIVYNAPVVLERTT